MSAVSQRIAEIEARLRGGKANAPQPQAQVQQQAPVNPLGQLPPEMQHQALLWAEFLQTEAGKECQGLLQSEFQEFIKSKQGAQS